MRAVMPKVHADAETSRAFDLISWDDHSLVASLSSINRSAVGASGTRSSASARTMRASPSLVDKEYACRKSSTPPRPPVLARMPSMRRRAHASMRRSACGGRSACGSSDAAMASSGGA